jgi:hypothetical protein
MDRAAVKSSIYIINLPPIKKTFRFMGVDKQGRGAGNGHWSTPVVSENKTLANVFSPMETGNNWVRWSHLWKLGKRNKSCLIRGT